MSRWKPNTQFFKTMPRKSILIFLLAVACLFGAIGSVNDSLNIPRSNAASFAFTVLATGVGGALWALFFTWRMFKSLIAMVIYQVTVFPVMMGKLHSKTYLLTTEQMKVQFVQHDAVVIICVVAAYTFFIIFFQAEGKRFFAAHTEIQLAAAIQRDLVPAISTNAAGFEFYGVSVPSGTVGGDLVDIVTSDGSFCAYVADIAGHGVPAGVVMSMVKSAVRMRLSSVGPGDEGLLPALNAVLQPLSAPNAYATFAYVSGSGPQLTFSLAGHLPVFHYHHATRTVTQRSVENLPVGMFPGVNYETGTIECHPGDTLAMITDGLTEIFARDGKELGSDHIEQALLKSAAEPLPEIASRILRTSDAFGQVTDDRTLLLVSRRGGTVS